jgi:predicted TIM-barrel fold metal-dependent hydrolase
MIIDIHGHVGRLGERVFSLPHMKQYLDTCGVERMLVSNLDGAAHHPGAGNIEEAPSNAACLDVCRDDARLVPLYWVRLGQVDANIHAFAGALDIEPFAGAVFSPLLNGFAADDPRLDAYLSVLAKIKKVAVFLSSRDEPGRPARAYTLAKRHPQVAVLLCNTGGDTHWSEALDIVGRAWQREDARLYLCTGRATADDVLAAVGAVGAERVLFGSDAPCLGERHAERCRSFLEQLKTALPTDAFANVVGENAARLFRLVEV